jgi:hypothetical protein
MSWQTPPPAPPFGPPPQSPYGAAYGPPLDGPPPSPPDFPGPRNASRPGSRAPHPLELAAAAVSGTGALLLFVWFWLSHPLNKFNSGPRLGFFDHFRNLVAVTDANSYFVNTAGLYFLILLVVCGAAMLLIRTQARMLGAGLLIGGLVIEVPTLVRFIQVEALVHRSHGFGGIDSVFFLIAFVALIVGAGLTVAVALPMPRIAAVRPGVGAILATVGVGLVIVSFFIPEFHKTVDLNSERAVSGYIYHHVVAGGVWILAVLLGLVSLWIIPSGRLRAGIFASLSVPLAVSFLADAFARNAISLGPDTFYFGLLTRVLAALVLLIGVVLNMSIGSSRNEPLFLENQQ